MNNFLIFILLGKGMTIRANIGKKTSWCERNGMIMDATGMGKFLGSGENNLVYGEDRLEVEMHRGCFNDLSGVELRNNAIMALFKEIFHSMGIDYLRGACDDALELILLPLLLELHG